MVLGYRPDCNPSTNFASAPCQDRHQSARCSVLQAPLPCRTCEKLLPALWIVRQIGGQPADGCARGLCRGVTQSVQSRSAMSGFRPRFLPNRRHILGGGASALVGLTLPAALRHVEEEKKLNFYNWDTYIGETTLADFNRATGIEVKMDLYADNDELFAKLKAGNPGYDVIVPTNDSVERMIKARDAGPDRPREDPQHVEHRQAIPGCGLRSRPQALNPLYVGDARHRLSQVARRRRDRQLEGAARQRQIRRQAVACSRTPNVIGCTQISRPLVQHHRSGADQGGRGAAHQAEEECEGVRRRQWPGSPGLGRGRCLPWSGMATSSR